VSLLDRLHEQYGVDGDLVVFRCTECGFTSLSLGTLHAHVETHRGYTRFGIQIPFTKTAIGKFDRLMDYTQVLLVTDTEVVSLSDVPGFGGERS
jgi:hypothetical protein